MTIKLFLCILNAVSARSVQRSADTRNRGPCLHCRPNVQKEVYKMVIRNKYESVLVLSTKTFDDAALEATVEKFKTLIAENGGTVENVDVWGKKRLAYAINYETEGYYAVINFESEGSLIKELDRVANITDGVMRLMTVKK